MDDEDVLYRFTLPYPWKRTLNGIYWITFGMFIISIALSWHAFVYTEHPPHWTSFYLSIFSFALILTGIALLMRYALIHGDKIKAPIKVTVTQENAYWEKGRARFEFYLTGIRDVKIEVDDKKAMIDVNYIEPMGSSQGWRIKFRRKDEFSRNEDYHNFVKETFPEFANVVKERIRQLNPDVKIKERIGGRGISD